MLSGGFSGYFSTCSREANRREDNLLDWAAAAAFLKGEYILSFGLVLTTLASDASNVFNISVVGNYLHILALISKYDSFFYTGGFGTADLLP